ncbi:STAS domain-containing protein [Amycolatopsis carbonis]|uniref:STAS domain-containing protein n=1 Tax=Amycolatopsis carbonis TaxID=715471 RepID=A0A9Y2I9H2_9PSEU|nr:STAS domain-containing protein [Amycolatopsis sp. 2-15]WIX75557.1 STAS domain-containing protein [Amycolatopsis sp. 2-15]
MVVISPSALKPGGRRKQATLTTILNGSAGPLSTRSIGVEPLRLSVERPDRDLVMVRVAGDLDAVSAPRLRELLDARLRSAVRAVLLDISAVTFLGTAGLRALERAHLLASELGVRFTVHAGEARQVRRAMGLLPLATLSAIDEA